MPTSKLESALERGLSPGGDLIDEIERLGEYPITETADAQALVAALAQLPAPLPEDERLGWLEVLLELIEGADSEEACSILAAEGTDELLRIYDATLGSGGEESESVLLYALKLLALMQDERGVERIIAAARIPLAPDEFMWEVIFDCFTEEHELWRMLCDGLRDPLPEGAIAVAYLDFVNQRALSGELEDHPFDTEAGYKLLERWLADTDEDNFGSAHSAATALPFLAGARRGQLLSLAMDHADAEIQLEGAWASARLGGESGVKMLARFAADPKLAATALEYLEELGRSDALPPEAREPDFQARAEICRWLAHPSEFGEAPDEIEVFDTRELYWPPTRDHRQVWLLKYRYLKGEDREEEEAGIGMVGSITFALFGETTADMSPEQLYGLHCCWELQTNEDPRAPHKRDGDAGWRLIREQA